MEKTPKASRRALVQLNVRVPSGDRDALQRLAFDGGVSVSGLLGAIVHTFLSDHDGSVPDSLLEEARRIDALRRRRPHLHPHPPKP